MDTLGLTLADIGAIGVLVFGGIMGLSSGLVHSILFIGSWAGAAVIAWQATPYLKPEVEKYVASPQIAFFATLLTVFVVALILLTPFASEIGKMVRASKLRLPDRILGLGFGAGCGLLVLSSAWLLYTYIVAKPNQPPPAIVGEARLFPLVQEGANLIEPRLPESFRTRAKAAGRPAETPAAPGTPPLDAVPPAPTTAPLPTMPNPGGGKQP